jgi:GxxExxY protein
VDLAQAAIGPGMAVFSRYARVLEADGSPMSVRTDRLQRPCPQLARPKTPHRRTNRRQTGAEGVDLNREWTQMNANIEKLVLKDEVYLIAGYAMEVLNGLGHGLLEKPYENALAVEFGLRAIPFLQQPRYDVVYKTCKVGEYVPDLIAFNAVVVDAKVIEAITDHEREQMINYLRITRMNVGVILNFRRSKLEWERIVLERGHQ